MQSSWYLFLIRHAQSANNAKPDAERIPDPPITSLGQVQSKRLARCIEKYKLTKLYCSPFRRAIETLKPSAEHLKLVPHIVQSIYEQGGCHRGHLPGLRFAEPGMNRRELEHFTGGWSIDESIRDSGWNDNDAYETLEQARRRALQFKEWYESDPETHGSHRVALMIHADFKIRLLEAFLGVDSFHGMIAEPVNTSISCLVRTGGRWLLDSWNLFDHLNEDEVST